MVAQVEATDPSGHYSPVDFNGGKSVLELSTAAGAFGGIKFYSDSGVAATGTDISGHAVEVAAAFYGANSTARPFVSDVHLLTSDDFLNKYLRPVKRGFLKLPAKLPGSPKVLNASFAGSAGSDNVDGQYLGRADYMSTRDGLLMVAGAVSDTTGTFMGATLIWGARNALAVRGSAAESVFDPSANGTGRQYADLWSDNTASVATGQVSGMAVTLMGEALAAKRPNAAKPQAIRAALQAGADRSQTIPGVAGWQRQNANGLDTDLGAGKASLTASQNILHAPAARFVAVSGSTIKGPYALAADSSTKKSTKIIPSPTAGLSDVFTVKPRQEWGMLFQVPETVTGLTAALDWNTVLNTGAVGNLQLSLCAVTITSKGVAQLDVPMMSVFSDFDNVRFLAYDGTLSAGTYAWSIKNVGTQTLSPAFAFQLGVAGAPSAISGDVTDGTGYGGPPMPGFVSVPEASSVWVIATLGGLGTLRRRRA